MLSLVTLVDAVVFATESSPHSFCQSCQNMNMHCIDIMLIARSIRCSKPQRLQYMQKGNLKSILSRSSCPPFIQASKPNLPYYPQRSKFTPSPADTIIVTSAPLIPPPHPLPQPTPYTPLSAPRSRRHRSSCTPRPAAPNTPAGSNSHIYSAQTAAPHWARR